MVTKTGSNVPPEKKSAVETYPDFTKAIQEQLGSLPSDDFIDMFLSLFEDYHLSETIEKGFIDALGFLDKPTPEVVSFLFDGIKNGKFYDDNYSVAIQTLAELIDDNENKKGLLVQYILEYLEENLNEEHQKIIMTLKELT